MWFPFALLFGVIAYAVGKGGSRIPPRPRQLALPPVQYAPQPGYAPPAQTPIAVLGTFVESGREPPIELVHGAIYEAEVAGCPQVADEIVQMFIVPAVHAQQAARASAQGGSQRALPPAPAPSSQQQAAPTPAPGAKPAVTFASDRELRAALDSDPEGFFARVTNPRQPEPQLAEMEMEMPMSPVPQEDRRSSGAPSGSAGRPAAGDPARGAGAPIDGIDPDRWERFVQLLERELPIFQTPRHVGPYRQRRDRLNELGIDPRSVIGNVAAARAALDADLADAFHRADDSGFIGEHFNRLIQIPGSREPHTVSLSGILGVIQSAGLEHAVDWFEHAKDRKDYPHTTDAFKRCNRIF